MLESYGIQNRIEVISNGIDLNYFRQENADEAAFRSKYGHGENDKVIMSAGLTIARKGIEDFVELARRMPEYQFIWFGETNLNTVPAKTRHIVQTRLPNLCFAGYAPREALRDAYKGCDLFWFPSKEETEGIVVLEALAMKTPMLLRDIPVYQDWLSDGWDVYKADSESSFEMKIRKLLSGELPFLTERGYRVAEERSLERVGAQLKKVYEEAWLHFCM